MKEFIMQETEEMITFGSVWKRYEPVAEIVRCKDCWKRQYDNCPFCEHIGYKPEKDFYCADGERRDS